MAIEAAHPTDNYLSFFLSKPIWDIWPLFLLGMARIVPIIVFAPFLGGKILSAAMKIGFGIVLTPLFFPYILLHAQGHIEGNVYFISLLLKEIFVGSVIGFLASVPFNFSTDAGSLIDHQRGSQSLQVTDPSTQVQTSPIGLLLNNIMIALFYAIGGPFVFFDAVFQSYEIIPADAFFNPVFFTNQNPLWMHLIKLLNVMLMIALQLAAPALIALLLSDLFLGIANRMAPQVQISFLLWSLKAFVGIAVLWAGWWLILQQLEYQSLTWIKSIGILFKKMHLLT